MKGLKRKRLKRIFLLLLLCLSFTQTAALPGVGTIEAKAAKEGLRSEKGKYCFYTNGKKLRNKWKTIDGEKYYFDKTGAAVAGKKTGGIVRPRMHKIKGKFYGFDNKGRMVQGLYVIDGQFYLFAPKTGAYQSSATNKLRAAAKEGEKAGVLLSLLKKQVGDPISREDYPDSCYGDGKDSVLFYSGFMVQLFTDKKGKTTVVNVNAAVRRETPGKEESASGTADEAAAADSEPEGAETADTEPAGAKTADTEAQKPVKRGLAELDGGCYFYQKNGKKLKKAWKKIGGYSYYFTKNGKAQTYSAWINGKLYVFDQKGRLKKGNKSRIVTIGIRKYYVDKNGCAITGWHIVEGKLYYADTKTGLLYQSRLYQGIKFSASCAAENSVAARLKMKTMSVLASLTNGGMSSSQKLRACWNYVVGGSFSYGSRYPNLNQGGWQKETALHMLNNHWGNCYSYACAFAALAKEIGYSPYVICGRVQGTRDGAADGMTRHAWVKIGGGYYDPEAQAAGWGKGIYGVGSYLTSIQRVVAF